ncbi:MAG: TraI/MobA(P) family conjugative relaxase [Myxococcota bacterium]
MIVRSPERDPRSGKRRGPRFGTLVTYMLSGRGEERVTWYAAGNLESLDEQETSDVAIAMVESQQELNRRVSDYRKTYHLVIAFHPDDRVLEDKELREIVDESLETVGLSEHPWIAVRHSDQEHEHVHVAVSKIHPITRNVHHPYRVIPKLMAMARQFETELGLHEVLSTRSRGDGPRSPMARTLEAQRGEQSFESWCKETLSPIDLDRANDWQALHARLARFGIELVPRGRGLCARDTVRHEAHCKASSIGRAWSLPALEKRFGPYEPSLLMPSVPELRYERRPARTLRSERLWNEYERERTRAVAARRKRQGQHRGSLGHAVIEALPLDKRHRAELYRQRAFVRNVRKTRRRSPYPPIPTWKEFLATRASRGDEEARRLLRKRGVRVVLTRQVGSVSNRRKVKSSRGTWIAREASARFAVTEKSVELLGQPTKEALEALFICAKRELGREALRFEGPARLRDRIERAATSAHVRLARDETRPRRERPSRTPESRSLPRPPITRSRGGRGDGLGR